MSRRKFFAATVPALILALLFAGAAAGAILQKGSQIVNLVAPLVNDGNIAFSELYIRNTDGSATPYTLPANTVLIITAIRWNFRPTDTTLAGLVQLNVGEYFRMRAQLANGVCGGSDGILPGAAATNMSANIFVEKVGDPTRTPIPGTLSMRLVCFTAPDE
jgi:hypothetical protein